MPTVSPDKAQHQREKTQSGVKIMPKADWSRAEQWVWRKVSAGRIAKFHELLHNKPDPGSDKGWCSDRLISNDFLREIFYDESLGKEIPPEGVQIENAWFRDKLDLRYGRLHRHLSLEACRFDQGIDLGGQTIEGYLSLTGSFISSGEGSTAVDLTTADIEGQLTLDGAKVHGLLMMDGLHVGLQLSMRNDGEQPAYFKEVNLTGAHIEGPFSLCATVNGKLTMDSLQVDRNMFIGSDDGLLCKIYGEVNLAYARIKGGLFLCKSSFEKKLRLDSVEIGASLAVSDVCCGSGDIGLDASLQRAKVATDVDFGSSGVTVLDLTSTTIAGELALASVQWKGKTKLILRNAHASNLAVGDWSRPRDIELNGFTYDRGPEGITKKDLRQHYIEGWLRLDQTYTPQPYEQLAKVLRAAGEAERASDVIYASRERARKKAAEESWARHLGMLLLKWTIGYGVGGRYFRCLWWIGGFTALGIAMLFFGHQGSIEWTDYFYSLDKLLPFAKLDEFKNVTLSPLAKLYYYIHQLVGYVLAGFLAAGLAGLTQKS
jgi:hypothetical protein